MKNSVVMVRSSEHENVSAVIPAVLYGPLAVHPEIVEWNINEHPVLRSSFPAGNKVNWTVTHSESGCIAATSSRKKLACAIASKLAENINWTGLRHSDTARIASIRHTLNAIISEVERKG